MDGNGKLGVQGETRVCDGSKWKDEGILGVRAEAMGRWRSEGVQGHFCAL